MVLLGTVPGHDRPPMQWLKSSGGLLPWRPSFRKRSASTRSSLPRRLSDWRWDSCRSIRFSCLSGPLSSTESSRSHHGDDDADRDQSQGGGPFSGASNARLGRLGRNGFDGRHCCRIIVVATALRSASPDCQLSHWSRATSPSLSCASFGRAARGSAAERSP